MDWHYAHAHAQLAAEQVLQNFVLNIISKHMPLLKENLEKYKQRRVSSYVNRRPHKHPPQGQWRVAVCTEESHSLLLVSGGALPRGALIPYAGFTSVAISPFFLPGSGLLVHSI